MGYIYLRKDKKRGANLEDWFEQTAEELHSLDIIFYHRLSPKRLHKGKYVKKAPADHLIVKENDWLIDTKECGKDVFYFNDDFQHQCLAMEKLKRVNSAARCGFLIWFYEKDPLRMNLRFVEEFDKPANIASGLKFDWGWFHD